MLFNWHKVNNVAQILVSVVNLAEGPKRSSLLKSFSVNEETVGETAGLKKHFAHDQHQQFLLS